MKQNTHLKIVVVLKAVLFGLFFANIARILWKTWKYGGSTSSLDISIEDDAVDSESSREQADSDMPF